MIGGPHFCRQFIEVAKRIAREISDHHEDFTRKASNNLVIARNWVRRSAIGLILVPLLPATGFADDLAALKEAMADEDRGDYTAATIVLEPLAEKGDIHAADWLVAIYSELHDLKNKARWDGFLADLGIPNAEITEGMDYQFGLGVPKDYVLAYKWFNLAASHGDVDIASIRDALGSAMTKDQVAEAQKLSREWTPKCLPLHCQKGQ